MTKRIFSRSNMWLYLFCSGLFLWVSCSKTESNGINPQTSTLSYILAHGTNTTIFNSAVIKGGLDTVFNSAALFTLLVPNDQACTQSGYSQDTINTFTPAQARAWVLYQTYAGTVLTFESFIGKRDVKLVMANGDSVFVSGDSNRTFVNGYQFLNSEASASNGIMLALQNVLIPPNSNLNQLVNADTSLSFLSEAIMLSSPVPDSISSMLSVGGPYSFFAPVNDAFRSLGYNSPSDLLVVSPDSLRLFVLAGLIPQRLFSYDINDSAKILNANNDTLYFTQTGILLNVKVIGDSTTANVINANKMAINGVLYKTDSLLVH